jgi:Domain of unknown function (DUF4352)
VIILSWLRHLPSSGQFADVNRPRTFAADSTSRARGPRTPGGLVAAAALAILCGLTLSACTPSSSAEKSPTPQVNRTVPAPNGGSVDEVITPAPTEPGVDVSITQPATLPTGVSVKLASVKASTVTAETPGELTGSAVIVTVTVTNDGKANADVQSAYLSLVAADGTFGIPTTSGPNAPLKGQLKPGQSATGSYVFMLSKPSGREVIITVNHSAGQPAAQFTGKVS